MTTIRDELPAAHRRFFPAIYDQPAITESRATCSDCAMCPKGEVPADSAAAQIAFKPNLKCCTYHPTIPNFLVGAVLSDSDPQIAEGQRRMKERVESRIGVTPMWLSPSRKYRVLLDAARGTSFGRSKVLLCPFFVDEGGGLCSVWRHREAVCSTFFCKHEAGAAGHAFWTANKQFIAHIEVVLSRHAARTVFPDATEPDFPRMRLTQEDLEDRAPKELDYIACWGEWAGRELEFYKRTHEVVAGLSTSDVDAILAEEPSTDKLRKAVEDAYEAIRNPKLAERLIKNPDLRALEMPNGSRAVTTYSAYDPIMLTPELWAVLDEFKAGETLAEMRERLDKEQDLTIEDTLLFILQNHAIVIPPP